MKSDVARIVTLEERMKELLAEAERIENGDDFSDMVKAYGVSKRIEIALKYNEIEENNKKEGIDERVFFVECVLSRKRGETRFQDYCIANNKENAISIFCEKYKVKSKMFA